MNRRRFVQAGGIVLLGGNLPGCSSPGADSGGATDGDTVEDADVSVVVVRNAPENPGPYEDPPGGLTPQESDALALEDLIFQRAGEKGLVVSGDAVNTSDAAFDDVTIEVTLYDENETQDEVLDSTMEQTARDGLDAGATWRWAATFDDEPAFEIDYYSVEATASYD